MAARAVGWMYFMPTRGRNGVLLAIAGTGFGLIGILVIILLVVLILYFVRRV